MTMSETARGPARLWCVSRTLDFGPRISFGFRHSGFRFCDWSFGFRICPGHVSLRRLDQFFNSLGVAFFVAVTGQWVRAARGLDQNLRPNQPGLDVYGSDFANAHAHFIHAEPGAFAAAHRLVTHLDVSGEKEIAARPA